jgi:hypothetical protein
MTAIIPALSLESRIKRRLRDHLRRLGFVRTDNASLVTFTHYLWLKKKIN